MNSSAKFWSIFWVCIVALCTSSTGMVWPLVLGGAIVAIAMAPNPRDDE